MILDAAMKLTGHQATGRLVLWDENSVPAAYYLRPRSEMLKSNKNAVSYLSLQNCVSPYIFKLLRHAKGGFSPQERHGRRKLFCPGL